MLPENSNNLSGQQSSEPASTIELNHPEYEAMNRELAFEEKAGFKLSPIQVKVAMQFKAWRFSLNRYEVGGGKTTVSTAVSLLNKADTTLVLVPPILTLPWKRWLVKFSDSILVYRGSPKERKLMHTGKYRWVVMSHAIFRKDFETIYAQTKELNLDVIVDEAHWLKSVKSKLYTCTGIISNRPRGSLQMLTGTPTSKPEDTYAYLKLERLRHYRSMAHFETIHVAKRDFFKRVIAYQELDVLSKRFAERSIHRTKFDIHGYQNDPLYPDTTYELSQDHKDLYEKMVEEQLLTFPDESVIDVTTATKLYHACQQIVVNYDYFSNDPMNRSAAYDVIDHTIEESECLDPTKTKLIIWTYYKLTSRSVLNYLHLKGYKAVGAYSEVNSEKNFDLFTDDPSVRIGVFQYQSAGAGLNPQAVCWDSLYLETTTVPLLMTQALGRIDRMGQKHIPLQRIAQAEGTIQQTLLASLLEKDHTVSVVERTKKSLRQALLGQVSG